MGVLNYYFKTSFWTKDTHDIIAISKFWFWDFYNNWVLDTYNIWYFLARLNFKITYYSQDEWWFEDFAKNHILYCKKRDITAIDGYNFDDSIRFYDFLKQEKNVSFVENKNFDLFELVKHKQHRSVLFLLWLDYYTLRNEPRNSNFPHWWHFVICSGIRDDKFIIHDPGPDVIFEMLVDKNILYKAIKYHWWFLDCMMIEYV